MRKASMLVAAVLLAACSRNPEPEVEGTGGAATTASDTTMVAGDSGTMGGVGMEGDTAQMTGDSTLVEQEGAAQPDQPAMESDTVMGDSTLVGQENDSQMPGDSTMMHGDSTMMGPDVPASEATPTDSAQGQTP